LLKQLSRLGLGLIGPVDAALDSILALFEHLDDARQQHLAEHTEHDDEADDPDDQLRPGGNQRILRRRRGR